MRSVFPIIGTGLILTAAAQASAQPASVRLPPANEIACCVEKIDSGPLIPRDAPKFGGTCAVPGEDNESNVRLGKIKNVPESQWCNAVFIFTKDINRSSAFLRYVVSCTVYGRDRAILGTGVSDDPTPDMYTRMRWNAHEVKSFGTSGSM